ncbi:unnamed protein product, partial [Closterium sp. Naga37s-1]
SLNFWGLTLASYALMLALPRKWSGYGVLFGSFTYLTYCHISNLGADVWRQGGVDFTGTLMVFTLKISGCAMDYQDGALPEDKAQHRMYSNRLARLPSVVEFLSFVFFPGAALVGPVFNLKQYQAYASGQGLWSPSGAVVPSKAADASKGEEGQQAENGKGEADRAQGEKVCEGKGERKLRKMPEPLPYAAQALGKAIICLAMHHFLSQHFGPALLFQPRFLTYGLAYKWGYPVIASICLPYSGQVAYELTGKSSSISPHITSQVVLPGDGGWGCLVIAGIGFRCSYYFIWSVAEAALILSGFGFSGWTDSSRPDWSRAENANFIKCEITTSMAQTTAYWNMGVGTWLRTYVYDRVTPRSGKPTMWALVFRSTYFSHPTDCSSSNLPTSPLPPASPPSDVYDRVTPRSGNPTMWALVFKSTSFSHPTDCSSSNLPTSPLPPASPPSDVYDRVTPRSGKPTMWTLVFTQVVSALWHGLQPGYYLFFVNGAIGQHTSKRVFPRLTAIASLRCTTLAFRHTAAAFPEPSVAVKAILDVLQAAFKMLIVNYSFAGFLVLQAGQAVVPPSPIRSFPVLQAGQTIAVWRSLFFMGTIVPILLNVLLSVIPTRSRRHRKKAE